MPYDQAKLTVMRDRSEYNVNHSFDEEAPPTSPDDPSKLAAEAVIA